MSLCLIRRFPGSWHPLCIGSCHESQKWVILVCAHPRHSSHLHNSFWHAGPTCGHFSHPYNHHHKLLSYAYEFWLVCNIPVSKTVHISDRCFIRKLVEALITNEHYCLRASNIELKLSTNILQCIDYRRHAQTLLSSYY